MEERTRSFEELIRWDREAHVGSDWHGTLLDYLEKVKLDPDLPKLAHARIYDLILSRGIREVPEGEHKTIALTGVHKTYNCFSDEFFGIEKALRHEHSEHQEEHQYIHILSKENLALLVLLLGGSDLTLTHAATADDEVEEDAEERDEDVPLAGNSGRLEEDEVNLLVRLA